LITAVAAGIALIVLGSASAKALSKKRALYGVERAVIPDAKITLPGFFDFFVETFVSFQDSILGKEKRKYLPLTATVFLYVFTINIIGLIPGIPAATTTTLSSSSRIIGRLAAAFLKRYSSTCTIVSLHSTMGMGALALRVVCCHFNSNTLEV
jgi:F0F1-type ATP synthase membrane subunit a